MILKSTGRENSFQVVRVISMIAAVVGIVVAMLLDNIFLFPVFAIVFWLIPRLYIISPPRRITPASRLSLPQEASMRLHRYPEHPANPMSFIHIFLRTAIFTPSARPSL